MFHTRRWHDNSVILVRSAQGRKGVHGGSGARFLGCIPLFFVAALFCGSGCEGVSSLEQPEIRVDPGDTLFFPRVVAGTEHRAPLVVRNVGRAPLEITEVSILGGDGGPFLVADAPSVPFTIEPGGSQVLTVSYSPTVGGGDEPDEDILSIRSNDSHPSRSVWPVRLRSANSGPVISVVPGEVDFSLVEGHRGPVVLTVVNSGTEPTSVASVELEGGSEFLLDVETSLPRSLDVGESFQVVVRCTTVDASDIEATTGMATLIASPESTEHQAGTATLFGPPVAVAGPHIDSSPLPSQPVYLNGRGSRSLGNAITTYRWAVTDWPVGSETAVAFNEGVPQEPTYVDAPSCPSAQNVAPEPCFIPDVPGTYRFSLQVADVRPLCGLGNPADPCGDDSECCSFQCTAFCGGEAGVGLCREGGGCIIEGVNTSEMEVRAAGDGLIVYLTWNGTGDFDLHLVDDFAGRCVTGAQSCSGDHHCAGEDTCDLSHRRWRGQGDCYWQNPQPDWGAPRTNNGVACQTSFDCLEYSQYPDCLGPIGDTRCTNTLDDPRLAKDESVAFGPEIIRLRKPIFAPGPPNIYHLGVHYFPDVVNYQARTATLRVFYEGTEVFPAAQPGVALSRQLTNTPGSVTAFWYAAWLVVTPTSLTLLPTGLPTFNVQNPPWPAIVDPP